MGLKLAIVGATGNVGREILHVLHERQFEADSVTALASKESEGEEVEFGRAKTLRVKPLENFDFTGTDIAFFAAGSEVSKVYVPKAAAAGTVVIDNSALYRLDPEVPLVVPEVNAEALAGYKKKNIIANPNCSTIQLVVALKPLHDAATALRVVVATYQSVSGVGRNAMDELFHQTRSVFVSDLTKPDVFEKQIAFNVIPKVGEYDSEGEALEEIKMVKETAKILDPAIRLTATCVRVPVFIGHAEAVNVEFEKPLTPERAREILRAAPGILLDEGANGRTFTTPAECVGEAATFVGRVRKDPTVPYGLNFWVVSDNLRKGAALNAVQIAEILINKHL
jgi:aspartate-semialdehyde dehydrogenase